MVIEYFKNTPRQSAYSMRLLAASGLQAAPVLRSGGMPVLIFNKLRTRLNANPFAF